MNTQILITLTFLAFINLSSTEDLEKIKLLDRKFRTRVANQPTAFQYETITDGVELGCWGYLKNGQPFRMYYVYDMKDYRFITTFMRFQVHPPSGKKRFAILTLKGQPDKEKITSEVLRYPEECL